MRMYPAYTMAGVLNEYALTFWELLKLGYKLRYRHYLMMVDVVSAPHMEKMHRDKFIKQLEWAAKGADDILKPSDDYSGIDKLRSLFNEVNRGN